jgi:uracil-DNA glycosylase family 4
LYNLRIKKIHNCPVLGFDFNHYVNAKVCSVCEAPGVYKPHKGEVYIDKLDDFHKMYDNRIQYVALIGQRLFEIFKGVNLHWCDVQHFNVVCCSPPDYRKPTFDETDNCKEYLLQRIKLLQKVKVIIAFGTVAKNVIKRFNLDIPIIFSYHPSYIFTYMNDSSRMHYIGEMIKQIKKYE